jgi:hypothetical protein
MSFFNKILVKITLLTPKAIKNGWRRGTEGGRIRSEMGTGMEEKGTL